jgi:hypothetical protein
MIKNLGKGRVGKNKFLLLGIIVAVIFILMILH